MNAQEREFARFLRLMDDCGCLKHVVVIGSWAELVYRRSGILEDYEPNIKTMDIDFLVRNLRRPAPAVSLTSLAKSAGYLVDVDRLTGVTKIYDPAGLEVEFLIGKMGAGEEAALKTNLGVTAQALRHTEILTRGMVTADYLGMRVNVPAPEAYAVHKMAINHERGAKREKDALAVVSLWPHLDASALVSAIGRLTKKEKARVADFMAERALKVGE